MYKNITVNECLHLSFLVVLRAQKRAQSAIKIVHEFITSVLKENLYSYR